MFTKQKHWGASTSLHCKCVPPENLNAQPTVVEENLSPIAGQICPNACKQKGGNASHWGKRWYAPPTVNGHTDFLCGCITPEQAENLEETGHWNYVNFYWEVMR